MTLIIILIAIVVQRFMKFNSYSHQFDWASHYFQWMNSKVKSITTGHGLVGVAILVVPIVLIAAIVFGIAYGFFGLLGVGILQLVLVWYCLDARDIEKEPFEKATSETILLTSYRNLFANLFWYGFFGPVGLVLYVVVGRLSPVIPKSLPAASTSSAENEGEADQDPLEQPQKSDGSLHEYLMKIQGVLDWVPVRLLGLSFALVGHFAAVFKLWLQKLFHGVSDVQSLVVEWGQAALKLDTEEGSPLAPAIHLVDRSLLVWLVVNFLLTAGVILG